MKSGFVGLVGRPNAGKSTLLNRLVGQKLAIVSDKPQTTRNRIVGVKTLPGGQMIYVDTPGIHRPLHRLNVRMVDISRSTVREVDVVALVVDAATEHGAGDNFVWDLVSGTKSPVVVVLNKIDLVAKPDLLPRIAAVAKKGTAVDIVPVSAETGENVARLEEVLLSHLPEGPALYPEDYLTDQPERFFVAELVREQVLAPHPRRAAVQQRRGRRRLRGAGAAGRDAAPALLDSGRARLAEADRARPRRLDDQGHRHGGAARAGALLRRQGVPRPPCEGQGGLARGSPDPYRHRPARRRLAAEAAAALKRARAAAALIAGRKITVLRWGGCGHLTWDRHGATAKN